MSTATVYDHRVLAVRVLSPSKSNPRREADKNALQELADSIKAHGILQPLLVREKEGAYEIVAGHRRFAAAQLAGLNEVPATVRELTDQEVLEIQVIENLQRADLHPLEEAEGYRQLHERFRYSIEDLAAKVGKSKAYIYARLKLCALSTKARKAFLADELSPAVALLVARIPDATLQDEAVKMFSGRRDPISVRDAAHILEEDFTLRLGDAPWDLTEDKLAGACACSVCPHRTGNQRELFAEIKSADVCTKPPCFKAKLRAWGQRKLEDAKAAGQRVMQETEAKKVFREHGGIDSGKYVELDRDAYQFGIYDKKLRQVLGKNAPPPIIARDPHSGNVVELLPIAEARQALKAAGKLKSEPSADRSGKTKAQRAKDDLRRQVGRLIIERATTAATTIDTLAWARWFVGSIVEYSWHDVVTEVMKRRGIDAAGKGRPAEQLASYAKTLDLPELRALLTELAITRQMPRGNWQNWEPEHDATCRLFHLDRKKLEREVLALRKTKPKRGLKRLSGVCRQCGCTEEDCSQCVEKTGAPCVWIEQDLCSACVS